MIESASRWETKPLLVFWETTRACLLACRHCRASAQRDPLPGELSTEEGMALIDEVASFGKPLPILILTGGDCLMRADIVDLVAHARSRGIHVAISPSVTAQLDPRVLRPIRELGVGLASISLDGACASTHDRIRGIDGHFDATLDAIRLLRREGFRVQVNTTVMQRNVDELADVAALMKWSEVAIWEVFFLVNVGRGVDTEDLDAAGCEDVCHLLVDASRYGFLVRTVEAPFFRRVAAWRQQDGLPAHAPRPGLLYHRLRHRLVEQLGEPEAPPKAPTVATRDGSGIIFVAHDGDILPSGFLTESVGNVRRESLVSVYRDHPLLRRIREGSLSGRCGGCEFRDVCGGSRARAHAASGDALGDDPACAYRPAGAAG